MSRTDHRFAPTDYRPAGLRWTRRLGAVAAPLELLGHQAHFIAATFRGIGYAMCRHRGRVVLIFTDLAWDNGRSQAGCRMTAEIGAMRISEEIDALEAQAIDPVPCVVSTRLLAAVVTVIPTYPIGLALGSLATDLTVTLAHGGGSGAYGHYFQMFVSPVDLAFSLMKVVVLVIGITCVHAYFGFYATGDRHRRERFGAGGRRRGDHIRTGAPAPLNVPPTTQEKV